MNAVNAHDHDRLVRAAVLRRADRGSAPPRSLAWLARRPRDGALDGRRGGDLPRRLLRRHRDRQRADERRAGAGRSAHASPIRPRPGATTPGRWTAWNHVRTAACGSPSPPRSSGSGAGPAEAGTGAVVDSALDRRGKAASVPATAGDRRGTGREQVRNQPECAAQGRHAVPDRHRALHRGRGAEGALHAVFFRSPVAHGRIDGLDLGDAAERPGRRRGLQRGRPRRQARERDGLRHRAQPRRLARGQAAPADARRRARLPRRRGDRDGRRRDPGGGARRDGDDRLRLRAISPCIWRPRRAGPTIHPEAPGNVGYDWSFGDEAEVAGIFARGRARHPARADRQPGDGDADGGARLLRGMGRRAAPRRLLRPGGLGAEGRADREARAGRRRRCG